MLGPVVLAIPAFFLLIGVEILVARARRRDRDGDDVYALDDALGNIGTGILDQTLGTLSRVVVPFALYVVVHERAALFPLSPSAVTTWVIAFLGIDFLYYWWHRWSHRVNVLWACHVVHHQSTRFNLSVALRQNWLTSFTSSPVYLPLALLGVPPGVFALAKSVNLLYQFWIHTRLIGKLGPLEAILNTPSHHRVHHGIDPRYLDRNFGGTFIVWDRLFGSFAPETHPPTYGVLHPLGSVDPVYAYVQPWRALIREARQRGSLRPFFAHPAQGLSEADLEAQFRLARETPPAPRLSRRRRRYLVAQLALVVLASLAFLVLAPGHPTRLVLRLGASLAWIAVSLVQLAALASGGPGQGELVRHLGLAALIVAWLI